MPDPKITPALAVDIADKRRAGFSLREIATWLTATRGVSVSPQTVKNTLDASAAADAKGAASSHNADAAPPPPTPPSEGEDGDPDVAALDRQIAKLEADAERLREDGANQAYVQVQRLVLDARERRRKLRPPAPLQVDVEAMAAGAKAVEKLRRLVGAARAELPPPSPTCPRCAARAR